MNDVIAVLIKKLSSKSVLERKEAIRGLKQHMGNSHMARLSLDYISEHDPSYTIRNLARQALPTQEKTPIWERTHVFSTEG
ncbi:Uncharacterised protein [Candidatus Bilamarchaeum dharawalense]|uniref:HEAT repeats n=1 Tax=Candidatus Bilamarchaeum dharawalense TaxID=2885759 RepID=A0A5E4LR19_9ARCH|nr:Uncharacterised protein [Candidatus Bilamarchaeum dharawalense]